MNALLAADSYPWTVIRVSWRDDCMKTLEVASVASKIVPLAEFIAQEVVQWSCEREPRPEPDP